MQILLVTVKKRRGLNYNRSDVLGTENLSFIIGSFEKYGLRKYVEPIIDFLWRLFL
jgi:hypothetical protein